MLGSVDRPRALIKVCEEAQKKGIDGNTPQEGAGRMMDSHLLSGPWSHPCLIRVRQR